MQGEEPFEEMINFLPLWERGASPTQLSSCLCSSWCRSQMEWSQSCQDAPWNVYVPSEPAWSPKNWGNSRHPMTWCSDTGPIESNKNGLVKVSCIMKTDGPLNVSMRNSGSYIIQSKLFAKHNATFFFLFPSEHQHCSFKSIMPVSVLPLWGWDIRPAPSHPA